MYADKYQKENLVLLRSILDYSPNYIFAKDVNRRFTLMNKRYIDVLKANWRDLKLQKEDLQESDILGKTAQEIFPKEYSEQFIRDDDQVIENGKTIVFEYCLPLGGVPHYFLTSKTPIFDAEGNLYGLCGISSDITKLKSAEKRLNNYLTVLEDVTTKLMEARLLAEQAMIAKSHFLANMSHEIRTPLNGVVASASLLFNTEISEKQKVYVDRIAVSANILLEIINRILDYSKIESGDYKLDFRPLNLRELIFDSYSIMISRAEEKGLKMAISYADDIPSVLIGDSSRLKEIFLNLIGNAIKFTERGEVNVRVFCADKQKTEALVRFEVKDTGIGISKNVQDLIFDKFFQADSTMTRRRGGSGLGLAITKELVALMGGQIGVESEPSKGSCFWFEIPFLLANE